MQAMHISLVPRWENNNFLEIPKLTQKFQLIQWTITYTWHELKTWEHPKQYQNLLTSWTNNLHLKRTLIYVFFFSGGSLRLLKHISSYLNSSNNHAVLNQNDQRVYRNTVASSNTSKYTKSGGPVDFGNPATFLFESQKMVNGSPQDAIINVPFQL